MQSLLELVHGQPLLELVADYGGKHLPVNLDQAVGVGAPEDGQHDGALHLLPLLDAQRLLCFLGLPPRVHAVLQLNEGSLLERGVQGLLVDNLHQAGAVALLLGELAQDIGTVLQALVVAHQRLPQGCDYLADHGQF